MNNLLFPCDLSLHSVYKRIMVARGSSAHLILAVKAVKFMSASHHKVNWRSNGEVQRHFLKVLQHIRVEGHGKFLIQSNLYTIGNNSNTEADPAHKDDEKRRPSPFREDKRGQKVSHESIQPWMRILP